MIRIVSKLNTHVTHPLTAIYIIGKESAKFDEQVGNPVEYDQKYNHTQRVPHGMHQPNIFFQFNEGFVRKCK